MSIWFISNLLLASFNNLTLSCNVSILFTNSLTSFCDKFEDVSNCFASDTCCSNDVTWLSNFVKLSVIEFNTLVSTPVICFDIWFYII